MDAEHVIKLKSQALSMLAEYTPKVVLALITLVIGLQVIKMIMRMVAKALKSRAVDSTLGPFLNSIVSWILRLVLFVSVASMLGIKTTSFVAVLGAAGLAIGLALQGSLSNFAGGVLILLFRPYKVGDLIEAQGTLGVVQEIQVFTTILLNPQNRRVIVPNGSMANGNIINLSAEPAVRIDTTVGISYNADMKQARELILAAVQEVPGVLVDPAPVVAVAELGDNSVNLVVRPYSTPEDYWDVRFAVIEGTKNALDKAGISIPFPQRDVHLFQEK